MPGNGRARSRPFHAGVDSGARDRNHHDAVRAGRQTERCDDVLAERVPQNDLLERSSVHSAESNRRTREHNPPIGRAATSSIQTPASFTRISACTGPSVRPSAVTARCVASKIDCLHLAGSRDGVEINGFLEERTVERIRLIEQSQRLKTPVGDQSFERELAPGNEILRPGCECVLLRLTSFLIRSERPSTNSRRSFGADHAAARRKVPAASAHKDNESGLRIIRDRTRAAPAGNPEPDRRRGSAPARGIYSSPRGPRPAD